MPTIEEGQFFRPFDILSRQNAVKMREKLPSARRFPLQVTAKFFRIQTEKFKPLFAFKVLGGGFSDLLSGRKVNVAIGPVDWSAIRPTVAQKFGKLRGPENLVNDCHSSIRAVSVSFLTPPRDRGNLI